MNRVVFLIDGFNLYHPLDAKPAFHRFKWLDLKRLAGQFISARTDTLEDVYYFTSLCYWDSRKEARHLTFINALRDTGVQIVFGKFKEKPWECVRCGHKSAIHSEKRTDVNIAIHLFRLAYEDKYDTAVVVSGDTDLVPAYTAVRKSFTTKRIVVAFPPDRVFDEIKPNVDYYLRIGPQHLEKSIFPDPVVLKDGTVLNCPTTWK